MGKFNTPPTDDFFESMKMAELSDKIEQAKRNAVSRSQLDQMEEKEDELVAKFLAGKLSSKQCELIFNEFKHSLDHVVIFQTPRDFERALKLLGMNDFEFEECLAHELAHFETSRQKKLRSRFCLKFFRENGRLGILSGVRIMINSDDPDDNLRNNLRDVTLAPENLSESDKRSLGFSNL